MLVRCRARNDGVWRKAFAHATPLSYEDARSCLPALVANVLPRSRRTSDVQYKPCATRFVGRGAGLRRYRELGLFFYGGATTVRSTEQGWLRRASIAAYSDSAKANSGLFCHLYSVEIDARADGALFGHCYKRWIKPDPASSTSVQIGSPAGIS
jgi:hypothetical protein